MSNMETIVLLFLHNSFFFLVKGMDRRIKRCTKIIGDSPTNIAVVCVSSFCVVLQIKFI